MACMIVNMADFNDQVCLRKKKKKQKINLLQLNLLLFWNVNALEYILTFEIVLAGLGIKVDVVHKIQCTLNRNDFK